MVPAPSGSPLPPPPGERLTVLLSYAYLRGLPEKRLEAILRWPWFDLMLDSGAFTAATTGAAIGLDEYCAFLDRWGSRFMQYVALDVIGDPGATDANLRAMLRRGYKPMPVHVLGDGKKRMDALFSVSERVCLGGMKRPGRGSAPESYVAAKMAWAAGRPVHWLGFVRNEPVSRHRPFSCDSSAWTNGHRYGCLVVYIGGRMMRVENVGAKKGRPTPAVIAAMSRCGFTVMDYDNPSLWRRDSSRDGPLSWRFLPMMVNADSYVRMALDYRKRFGTRLFLVSICEVGELVCLMHGVLRNMGGRLGEAEVEAIRQATGRK